MQRSRIKCWEIRRSALRLFELALVLVRFDLIASVIVKRESEPYAYQARTYIKIRRARLDEMQHRRA
jgi:hypothetical protein